MRVGFDKQADAAYIYIDEGARDTQDFSFTYARDPEQVNGQIHLDSVRTAGP